MNRKRITRALNILTVLFLGITSINAQEKATINAVDQKVSENLNLEAVVSVFGDAKNLEDFEIRLNDPKTQLSNLDLNEDNYVDYLRVIETTKGELHLITIQAVLGNDLFQDVATIEVEGEKQIQIVGDVYIYGPNYIIEPVFVHKPLIYSIFWRPYYKPYRSKFYWGYYPKYFNHWKPFYVHTYRKNIAKHINSRHRYTRTLVRKSNVAVKMHTKIRRNDIVKKSVSKRYIASSVRVNNATKKRVVAINKVETNNKRGVAVKTTTVKKKNKTKKPVKTKKVAKKTKKVKKRG